MSSTTGAPASAQPVRNDALQRLHSEEAAAHDLMRMTGRPESARAGNPFETIWQLSREIDRVMGTAFNNLFETATGARPLDDRARPVAWVPQIDVALREDALVITADLPGVDKEDVRVELGGQTVTIHGERRGARDAQDGQQGLQVRERSYGSFLRTIPLPKEADAEQLKAQMRNGVLTLNVPFHARAKSRRVTIEG